MIWHIIFFTSLHWLLASVSISISILLTIYFTLFHSLLEPFVTSSIYSPNKLNQTCYWLRPAHFIRRLRVVMVLCCIWGSLALFINMDDSLPLNPLHSPPGTHCPSGVQCHSLHQNTPDWVVTARRPNRDRRWRGVLQGDPCELSLHPTSVSVANSLYNYSIQYMFD